MKLDKIMIAGVDETVSLMSLEELQQIFPMLEYGVLYSSREGLRYPSQSYIQGLCDSNIIGDMSAHLCGKYSRQVLEKGDMSFAQSLHSKFTAIQLNYNFGRSKGWNINNVEKLHRATGKDVILQYNKSNAKLIDSYLDNIGDVEWLRILYDASGGRGKEMKVVPTDNWNNYTGYAGGIDSYNLHGICMQLNDRESNHRGWIDLESGVRDENNKIVLAKIWYICSTFVQHSNVLSDSIKEDKGNLIYNFTSPVYLETTHSRSSLGTLDCTMTFFQHSREEGCIEWEAGDNFASIGVWFEDGKLVDYDGVFDLPPQAKLLIIKADYDLSEF